MKAEEGRGRQRRVALARTLSHRGLVAARRSPQPDPVPRTTGIESPDHEALSSVPLRFGLQPVYHHPVARPQPPARFVRPQQFGRPGRSPPATTAAAARRPRTAAPCFAASRVGVLFAAACAGGAGACIPWRPFLPPQNCARTTRQRCGSGAGVARAWSPSSNCGKTLSQYMQGSSTTACRPPTVRAGEPHG